MTRSRSAGFSLPELLIALLLGGVLSTALMQALLLETRLSQRLGRGLRERQLGQRALELVRQEALQASWLATEGQVPLAGGCSLAGRRVVLQLGTASGVITYSVGAAPSSIWRGRVLMRCGPAYGLAGELGQGEAQNRVLLDALPADGGFVLEGSAAGPLQVRLARQLAEGQRIEQALVLPALQLACDRCLGQEA